MYTYQQRLEYARKLKRLHELYVIKDNIHLTYKYKNQNKAIHNAHSLQDKIINSIIDDAVYGNANAIKNIDSTIEKLMNSTLENERKRIHHQNDKYVNRAVELNSERYTKILTNRINTEAIKLERKIESELRSGVHNGLSESQTRNVLQEKYQDTAKARIRNIIRDSVHTNESNINFINALNEGYNYKIWMNGRSKGKTRAWHKAKLIAPVPIEDYFDIYGPYGHKESMYPGDLYSGAENVANCRCWLRYTNRRPEGLSKTPNTYNIPNTSYLSPQNKPTNNANKENILTKPLETFKTRISNTNKKVTSKIKQITKKITSKISLPKVESIKSNFKNKNNDDGFKELTPNKQNTTVKENSSKNKNEPRTIAQIRNDLLNDNSFTKFIGEILHHNNKTKGELIEYLTLVSKSQKILKRLIKGEVGGVNIPKKFKNKRFHMTIHNHSNGAIIPSYEDLRTNFNHYAKYGVITAGTRVGVVNLSLELNETQINLILAIHSTFEGQIYAEFHRAENKKLEKKLSKKEYNELFFKFVSKNIDKYVNEFNSRQKDYNVELTYINTKE